MRIYRTKAKPLPGTSYSEIHGHAELIYKELKRKTNRRPYVRSAFFKREKVFLDVFFRHMHQKNWRDRVRRLKFFPCALELIDKSTQAPQTTINPNRPTELLHRFAGVAGNGQRFSVQIKENRRSSQKALLSIFPS